MRVLLLARPVVERVQLLDDLPRHDVRNAGTAKAIMALKVASIEVDRERT
jgi:hypothetical protein